MLFVEHLSKQHISVRATPVLQCFHWICKTPWDRGCSAGSRFAVAWFSDRYFYRTDIFPKIFSPDRLLFVPRKINDRFGWFRENVRSWKCPFIWEMSFGKWRTLGGNRSEPFLIKRLLNIIADAQVHTHPCSLDSLWIS